MKYQFLREHHNRQDKARKAEYQEDIHLKGHQSAQHPDVKSLKDQRVAILASVRKSVPFFGEFQQLFPDARTSLEEGQSGRTRSFWTFKVRVGLYGRYVLEAELQVITDTDGLLVLSTGKPKVILLEIRSIIEDGNGGVEVHYEPTGQVRFGAAEWRRLVEVGGDFSAIGYHMVTTAPFRNFAWI
jgi:hypothetical protein